MPKTTSTERVRAFRERQGAQNLRKPPAKSGAQRAREFRARRKALRMRFLAETEVPLQSPEVATIDNGQSSPESSATSDIRRKWKYLRDQFRREVKKAPKSYSDETLKPTWPYFPQLLFLEEQMIPKETTGNIPSCSSESTSEMQSQDFDIDVKDEPVFVEASDLEFAVPSPEAEGTVVQFSEELCPERPKMHNIRTDELNAKLSKLEERIDSFTNSDQQSDDYHFFMSLIPAMKKFNDYQKFRIRNKFQQILMDEMCQTDNSNLSYFSSTPVPSDSMT